MEINKLFVLGSGLMGSGISQVAATAGFDIILMDTNEKALDKAMSEISLSLNKFASKGKLNEQPNKIISRIHPRTERSSRKCEHDCQCKV